jgi:hypothetical protein
VGVGEHGWRRARAMARVAARGPGGDRRWRGAGGVDSGAKFWQLAGVPSAPSVVLRSFRCGGRK